jgi:C_GCAxxG_C_C family probable redox protein
MRRKIISWKKNKFLYCKRYVMKEELIKQACIKAGNYYRDGYNCAESLFLTFMEYTDSKASPELVRLATPFGGGLGHSGCSCGALTGAVLVIGLFKGRITTAESKKIAYELSSEYHNRFKREFGATCCRTLRQMNSISPEIRNCQKIVGQSAGLFMQMLIEKGIVGQ